MHNRKPNRLQGYDYSKPGKYFVTICVHNRFTNKNVFGTIENNQTILNETGLIVQNQWIWITEQYNHISHDEWIIMPDHIHGIITIKQMGNVVDHGKTVSINGTCVNTGIDNMHGVNNMHGRDRSRPVPTNINTTTTATPPTNITKNDDTNINKNVVDHNIDVIQTIKIKPLDQIIGAFKTTSSKLIHQTGNRSFAWQRSYYDRIVRDKEALYCIRQYIKNNPCNPANNDSHYLSMNNMKNRDNDCVNTLR